MSMREFLREYRETIDNYILKVAPNLRRINDEERREWVMNDEALYRFAQEKGVKI